jgi:hypothetical protein
MLLVSESGASRKDKRGKTSFSTFDLGVKEIILTIHMPNYKAVPIYDFRPFPL